MNLKLFHILQRCYTNRPIVEFEIAAQEQMKITELRLAKLFSSRENISSSVDKYSAAKKAEGTSIFFVMFFVFLHFKNKNTFSNLDLLRKHVTLCSTCFPDSPSTIKFGFAHSCIHKLKPSRVVNFCLEVAGSNIWIFFFDSISILKVVSFAVVKSEIQVI